jgi:hypothetical protein
LKSNPAAEQQQLLTACVQNGRIVNKQRQEDRDRDEEATRHISRQPYALSPLGVKRIPI